MPTLDNIIAATLETQLTSVALLSGGNTPDALIPFDFSNSKEKQMTFKLLREIARLNEFSEAWCINEAWMAASQCSPDTPLDQIRKTLPDDLGDAPNREEVLICYHERHGLMPVLHVLTIERAKDGSIAGLHPRPDADSSALIACNSWILAPLPQKH